MSKAIRPDLELVRYVDCVDNDVWCVCLRFSGVIAQSRDPAAMVAAMRLIGGEGALREDAEYLRSIGCTPGHPVLDALEGRFRINVTVVWEHHPPPERLVPPGRW